MREYQYFVETGSPEHAYLVPSVLALAGDLRPARILDLGCGNGLVTAALGTIAPAVGVDVSVSGIEVARRAHPNLTFEVGSVYEDLPPKLGRFPLVVSLEVVEHLYDPRTFAKTVFDLVEPGGTAVISTPYHGYLKNLALALSGRMDKHFTALWDGGHIKFWSMATLSALLVEAGFGPPRFLRVGRVPPLAKSMIAVAKRP